MVADFLQGERCDFLQEEFLQMEAEQMRCRNKFLESSRLLQKL